MTIPTPSGTGTDVRLGRVAFGFMLLAIAGGLCYLGVAPQHWLRGVIVVAAGLLFGGIARAAISDTRAGPLAVRSRWFDVVCYAGVAALMFGFALAVS